MKVCGVCGLEIGTRDGDNECARCQDVDTLKRRRAARARKRAREQVLSDLGLVKVRGALGGTYWE
ncbi:MAG: hypothetical protein KIPDCIKN_04341 [Haliscomenobacter sp.]|nr:hypothetical protein [Haliscomenobacter sp.]